MSLLGGEGGNGGTTGSGGSSGGTTGGSGGTSSGEGSGQGNSGSGSGGAGAGSGASASWRDTLPEDIRGNATLTKFTDVNSLAKSYIDIQGLIGKKGVFPPGEKATKEQLTEFYKNIGQPELEKFEIKAPEGKKFNTQVVDAFKKVAHEGGLLPRQAQSVLDWYLAHEEGAQKSSALASVEKMKTDHEALKKEWGEGYDKQIALANMAVKEVGGEEAQKYLNSSKLANDVQLVKLLAKMGARLGEDKLRGDGGGKFGSTPSEIQAEIDKVRADLKHAYYDRSHPGHARAVKDMEALYQKLHG